MRKNNLTFLFFIYLLFVSKISAQIPFTPIDTAYSGKGLRLPKGLKYDVIFREGEIVQNEIGAKAPSKGNHDFNQFIPINGLSRHGYFYVSHETNDSSRVLGDGGGGTIFEVEKLDQTWVNTGPYYNVDFSTVGGTYDNCGGCYTPKGTILTAEEFPPSSNKSLYRNGTGLRDTTDFNGMKRYKDMGWMVEVDPLSKKALHKLYKLGRFSHEGIVIMPDSMTIYMSDDNAPAVFFKFVAQKPNDFTEGQLYAYKQSKEGRSGSWIILPMELDSLVFIRDIALRRGATVFLRLEWMTRVGNKIYITETGYDDFILDKKIVQKGELAIHLHKYIMKTNKYDYPYGSVLEFNSKTDNIRCLLAGGRGQKDKAKFFSNPDAITYYHHDGKNYLVISEDLIAVSKGRVTKEAEKSNKFINEIWWLDLSIVNPEVDDLQRFMIAPEGAETTGGAFTPDFKTYFVNIQHPSSKNSHPFNKSATIAVTGFNEKLLKTKNKVKNP